MKKIIAVLLTLILCTGQFSCINNKTTVINFGSYQYEVDGEWVSDNFTKDFDTYSITGLYHSDDVPYFIITAEYDNSKNLSLKEFAAEASELFHGCIETGYSNKLKQDYYLIGYYIDDEVGRNFTYEYYFKDGNEISGFSYNYNVKEVNLGQSDLYIWLPEVYEEGKTTQSEGITKTAYKLNYKTDHLPNMSVYIGNTDISYESAMNLFVETDFMSEAEFDALSKDGFTLDEILTIYQKAFADVDEIYTDDFNGHKVGITVYFTEENDIKITNVLLTRLVENEFIEIHLSGPTESWTGLGEAFANASHFEKLS